MALLLSVSQSRTQVCVYDYCIYWPTGSFWLKIVCNQFLYQYPTITTAFCHLPRYFRQLCLTLSGREGPYGPEQCIVVFLPSEGPFLERLQGPYGPPLFFKPFEFGVIYMRDFHSITTFQSSGSVVCELCFQVHFTGKEMPLYT